MKTTKKLGFATILSAAVCTSPAFAQQSDDSSFNNTDSKKSSEESSEMNRSEMNRGEKNSGNAQIDPRGWVAMAVDYDNDGRYDAVETIYVYDLEKARQQSDQRRKSGDEQRMSKSGPRSQSNSQTNRGQGKSESTDARPTSARIDYRSNDSGRDRLERSQSQDSQDSRQQIFTVNATIDSLQSMNMVGMDKKFQVAKVSTDDGKRLAVWMGLASDLSKLNLFEGDQVEVRGCKGRLNDRTILFAKQVRHDGQSVTIESPGRTKMKRIKAEVLQTRTVKFRNIEQPHVVARVRTQSGSTEMVNMGPKSKYRGVEIGEGTELKLLVRQGRLNGKEALIAQEVNVNGKTVKLLRPEDRTRFSNRPENEDRSRKDDGRA